MLGLACGDAIGTTVEFQPRGLFPIVTDMIGGGPFELKPGEWTDDTSMALCLATSLVERNGFDPHDQMMRYCKWAEEGYMSSNGYCFDVGMTVSFALNRYKNTGDPYSGSTDPRSAGNGCIMRLAPIPMFFFPDHQAVIKFSGESSRTTHRAIECVDSCRLFGSMIFKALLGYKKEDILFANHFPKGVKKTLSNSIQAIADGAYRNKSQDEIEGSGYVVKCLEAALWCFSITNNFREAILKAANLGGDADTTAAVCGQIAGAYYGEIGIPKKWRHRIAKFDLIVSLAESLLKT